MCFQNLSFLSQIPFLSIMHLRTYTAGIAPYYSCAGILVSSMVTIVIVPGADPNIFFLNFYSLDSTESCIMKWEVVEVKIKGEWSILLNCMLFPVPDGPVIKIG